MSNQAADLHRSLLRPAVIHILRGVGFHSTKPSVLDALVNITERYLLLLAMSTAYHAQAAHNDNVPTVSDARHALAEAGSLIPVTSATEEEFRERMRRPLSDYAEMKGGQARLMAETRRRDEQDTRDVQDFTKWFDSPLYAEIKRVAGMAAEDAAVGHVGVGGQAVVANDFLTVLKRKRGKAGQDIESKFAGTVIGTANEDNEEVHIDGGAAKSLRLWVESQVDSITKGAHMQTAMEIESG